MRRHPSQANRATVTLVALCFIAVLGITLASYIAVCSRAMNLSNRSYQVMTSQQLAEMGIDEALRAFNKNNWADWTASGISADWTVSGTTASCNLTFPAGKFGQGVTSSVKIRVDNYNANQLDSTYSASATYRMNALVYYSGTAGVAGNWYRSVKDGHSGNTPASALGYPDMDYWVPAPIPWMWSSNTTYKQYDVVCYGGTWYYSNINSNTSTPTNVTNWTALAAGAAPSLAIMTFTTYAAGTFAFRVGDSTWYRCTATHTMGGSWTGANWTTAGAIPTWAYKSSTSYNYNDVVFYSGTANVAGTWYRCIAATSTGNAPTNTTYWENALTGSNTTTSPGMHGWSSSSINYNLGDVVCYYTSSSYNFYRCIRAHTSSGSLTPTNTTYWSTAPLFSTAWDSNRQYSQNDTVRYNGVWYRYINGTPSSSNFPTNTTYWIGANTATASYQWNATTTYAAGDHRCYGGVWYKCTAGNTGQSPNNTSYWTAAWANSFGVTTGAPVVYAEGTIAITGSPPVRTQLRATIAPAPLFPNAIAATTTISANSGGTVDSYDSNTGTYASQVGTATNYSAVVAAGNTSGTAVTLSTPAVKGYVAAPSSSTSPYAPLFSSGGSVKGLSSPASPNIDLTRISRSPYIPQFDTLPLNPSGGGGGLAAAWANTPKGTLLTLSATTTLGTPGATTPSRYYYPSNLTIGSGSIGVLRIIGPVILYVSGDLFISNPSTTGRIEISGTGSAEIHVTGVFKADAGGDGIINNTSDPKSLIIICDTTSTATHFYSEGVNPLYGVIYIPYSTSTTGYFNDNTGTNIYGAISANKVTYSGANLNIHYDSSLRYATFGGVDQPYTVTEWRELPATEQATMP